MRGAEDEQILRNLGLCCCCVWCGGVRACVRGGRWYFLLLGPVSQYKIRETSIRTKNQSEARRSWVAAWTKIYRNIYMLAIHRP
jgi:hypothetical protein